jgi:hypothetical protein
MEKVNKMYTVAVWLLFGSIIADLSLKNEKNRKDFKNSVWLSIVLLWPILLPISFICALKKLIFERKTK